MYRLDGPEDGPTFLEVVERVEREVRRAANSNERGAQFFALALCYSFLENALKFLNWNHEHWCLSHEEMSEDRQDELIDKHLLDASFDRAIKFAREGALADRPTLINSLTSVKDRRNNIVHQLWLLERRTRIKAIRSELEDVESVCEELMTEIGKLSAQTGGILLHTALHPFGKDHLEKRRKTRRQVVKAAKRS